MENKTYINNLETGKIELHFTKEEYKALPTEQQKEIKSAYLFSKCANAWVSRSKNNHYRAIQVAKKLGFTEEEKQGRHFTYEEELNKKVEKAEHKIKRYESYSDNAEKRAKNMQSEFNNYRNDIAFLTQPNINSSAGRSFTRQREKIINRYNKGFEEYRKSEYFQNKADATQRIADKEQLKDKVYLCNRIKECKSSIKKIESNIVFYEDLLYKKENNIEIDNVFYKDKTIEQLQESLQNQLERLEYQRDKRAFMQNNLDKLGGTYTKADLKEGYLILCRHGWMKVKKVNIKTVYAEYIENNGLLGMTSKVEYSEIKQIKVPEGFKEKKEELRNPYSKDDILVCYSVSGNRVIEAYQVIKVTAKGVQLQKINIDHNRPMKDSFTLDKPIRKKIVKSNYSNFVGCYSDNWQLHKWKDKAIEKAM